MTTTERLADALAYLDALHVPDGLTQSLTLNPDGNVEIDVHVNTWEQANTLVRTIDPDMVLEHWDTNPGEPGGAAWGSYEGPGMPQHTTAITVYAPQGGIL